MKVKFNNGDVVSEKTFEEKYLFLVDSVNNFKIILNRYLFESEIEETYNKIEINKKEFIQKILEDFETEVISELN